MTALVVTLVVGVGVAVVGIAAVLAARRHARRIELEQRKVHAISPRPLTCRNCQRVIADGDYVMIDHTGLVVRHFDCDDPRKAAW